MYFTEFCFYACYCFIICYLFREHLLTLLLLLLNAVNSTLWLLNRCDAEKTEARRKKMLGGVIPPGLYLTVWIITWFINWLNLKIKERLHNGYFQKYLLKGSVEIMLTKRRQTTKTLTNMEHTECLNVTWVKSSVQHKKNTQVTFISMYMYVSYRYIHEGDKSWETPFHIMQSNAIYPISTKWNY